MRYHILGEKPSAVFYGIGGRGEGGWGKKDQGLEKKLARDCAAAEGPSLD